MQYELLYVIVSACLVAYYVIIELGEWHSWKREKDFLTGLEVYLGHVRHYYYRYGVVRRAIQAATDRSHGQVREQCLSMCSVLDSADREREKREYLSGDAHKYLKMLLSFVCLIDDQGDRETTGESIFLDSVLQLRLEVSEEKRHRERVKHRYMGLTLLAGLPILTVTYVSDWCIQTIPSLETFYYSRGGAILRMLILAITCLSHETVVLLSSNGRAESSPVTRGVRALITILPKRVTEGIAKWMRRIEQPLNATVDRWLSRLDEVRQLAARYCERALTVTLVFGGTLLACGMGELESSQGDRALLTDVAVAVGAAIMAYGILLLKLWFRAYLSSYRVRDEVMQFQMLIRLQRKAPGVDVCSLLESFEAFACLLRPAICRCVGEMNISYHDALEELYAADTDTEFRKLVACFMTADEVGIERAFDEIAADMDDLQASEKQQRQISLDNGSMLGNIIAVLPGGLILIGYLMIPFAVRSLLMFGEYRDELMKLMGN